MTPAELVAAVEAQRVAQSTFRLKDWKQNLEALISPEALEALLASQPREWAAETMNQAPRIQLRIDLDHAYRVRNRATGEWSHSLHTWLDARDLMVVCFGDQPPADAAYGPIVIPQPPESARKEGET